ncbi:hypothetical protein RND71_003864 [Anisodus tanguticus]|uniref:mRNA export factor GLE1 n=1 Tax=Anisodus tanguticus TaxID=243964 RepID=A0AAE1SXJ8_9SOLA|nr:hypothetical protein RND71_003864 [Anisodus tanguticus]
MFVETYYPFSLVVSDDPFNATYATSTIYIQLVPNRLLRASFFPLFTGGAIKLQPPLPKSVDGVTLDPNPDWSFYALLVELNSIEKKLNASSKFPFPFTKTESRQLSASKDNSRRGFVMQVSNDDVEDMDGDTKHEVGDHLLMGGKRFACDEFCLSDSDQSEGGLHIELQRDLMDKVGLVESAFSELAHEHQLTIAMFLSGFSLMPIEAGNLADNKSAEALDDHLTAVQRDHEHKSQIEERNIRDDAAREEAKRKEKALQEEKARQERIRAEAKRLGNGVPKQVKADELLKLISGSTCPQSISIAMFTQKVVSLCVNPTGSFNSAVYAYCHVVVHVTSKVPLAMDILIAELNKVCIYTVPKYIMYSEAAFQTKEAHFKAIGYAEEDGKIEKTDSYMDRLSAYMKLYGALVQTEVEGCHNLHGLREGWAWIARFLNVFPANLYTATALLAFFEMAGFALHRRYKIQFKKLLDIIAREFLTAFKDRGDEKLTKLTENLRSYIELNELLHELQGWRLRSTLDSHIFAPDSYHDK